VSQIVRVACDEPSDGDVSITGALTVKLRAERDGKGDGRVYTIHVSCTDSAGNVSTGTVDVTVPHDQGEKEAATGSPQPSGTSVPTAPNPPAAPTPAEPAPTAVAEPGTGEAAPQVAAEEGSTTEPQVATEESTTGSTGGGGTTAEPSTLEGGSGLSDPPADPTEEEDEYGVEPIDPKKANGELKKE
jgi:hypothetical protein